VESAFGIVFITFLAVIVTLLVVQMARAFRGAKKADRQMVEYAAMDLCPCCGSTLSVDERGCCPGCKNFIRRYVESAGILKNSD